MQSTTVYPSEWRSELASPAGVPSVIAALVRETEPDPEQPAGVPVPHDIRDPEFFRGGNAIFTVSGPSKRYTFKIRRKDATEQYPTAFFVSLLTGPDNTSSYTYLGMMDPKDLSVRLTSKSQYKDDSQPVKAVRWALKTVRAMALSFPGAHIPDGYKIQHEGRCCRCGRVLTVPKSIEIGFGPECAGKTGLS